MASILFVSKPVAPPWNDSSKNLVRDLAAEMSRHQAVVLGARGVESGLPTARVEPLYAAGRGGFAPALRDRARVFRRLATGPREDAWHFFFAPNPTTSRVARATSTLRRVRTLQTVCSAPLEDVDIDDVLFADITIVLSRHTEARLRAATRRDIRRIPPGIAPLPRRSPEERAAIRASLELPASAPIVVYPGDLEFGTGAELAIAAARASRHAPMLVMACRLKTPEARQVEARLRIETMRHAEYARVRWIGETQHIHDLLAVADVVLLPATTLYAKMDYPLVLLEAMSMARPCLVTRGTPAEELAEDGGALAVDPDVGALTEALDRLLDEGSRIGEAAAAHVRDRFDRKAMAIAYESLYDELLR